MLQHLHHLIHGLPFPQPVPEHLRQEFESWPGRRRRQLLRKVAQRELAIRLSGQGRRRVERAPAGVRRMLWWTTWTTVGDAIMDLSPRVLLPQAVQAELLIAPSLAPLFARDPHFTHVHTGWETVQGRFDFLLVNHFSTDGLAAKRRHLPEVPFAAMLGHMAGEMFSRVHFADARMRQLFDLPPGEPAPPRLWIEPLREDDGARRFEIAVALGARDERRRYRHWPAALAQVQRAWPAGLPAPRFHLFGTANARPDAADFDPAWLRAHTVDHIERLDLLQAARRIAGCDAFIGADGGLMHLAAATGVPGVAMFGVVPPEYRLLPASSIVGLPSPPEGLPPEVLAQALVDRVHGTPAHGGLGHLAQRHA